MTGAYRELGLEPTPSSQRVHAFQWMKLPHLQEVRGQTLGLIGFGEIGTEVAKRARAFDMNVLYFKREPLPAAIEEMLGVRAASLDDLLRRRTSSPCMCPTATRPTGLIGARELALMKPTASIINTCRDQWSTRRHSSRRCATARSPPPGSTSSRSSRCNTTARSPSSTT